MRDFLWCPNQGIDGGANTPVRPRADEVKRGGQRHSIRMPAIGPMRYVAKKSDHQVFSVDMEASPRAAFAAPVSNDAQVVAQRVEIQERTVVAAAANEMKLIWFDQCRSARLESVLRLLSHMGDLEPAIERDGQYGHRIAMSGQRE